MKKIAAFVLAAVMIFCLAACGKSGDISGSTDVELSAAEKARKTEYYKTWAESDDFGTEGKYTSMDLKLNDTVFVLEKTSDHMLITVNKSSYALYETDNKIYLYSKTGGNGGKVTESWTAADIPSGSPSVLSDESENRFNYSGNYSKAEYVGTVKNGEKTYDILDLGLGSMFSSDQKDNVYKVFVNADTHKIDRIEFKINMEDPKAGNEKDKTITVTGTVKFTDGEDVFKAPQKVEETSYESLLMNFAYGLMSIVADDPLIQSFM